MDVYKLFLIVHIFAGSIGLIAGTIVIEAKKGNDFHRFIGNIFFYSMLFAGVSAFVLSILKSNVFLFILGVFTVYMVLTGKSYLYYKRNKSSKIRVTDKLVFLLMSLTVIAFVLFVTSFDVLGCVLRWVLTRAHCAKSGGGRGGGAFGADMLVGRCRLFHMDMFFVAATHF
jgi:uncharacterized membrane protein